jgi:hypothetical protein
MEAVAAEGSKNLSSFVDGMLLNSCGGDERDPAVLPEPIETARFLDEADMACEVDMTGLVALEG